MKRNPDRQRIYAIKKYGLDAEKYEVLLRKQANKCAICRNGQGARRLHVDHDHQTGDVRGLLCHFCNTALGLLGDDTALMARAIKYLEGS
jgi:hypothetical protein